MQKIQLNFVGGRQNRASWWDLVLLLAVIVLTGFLLNCYQETKTQINLLQQKTEANPELVPRVALDLALEGSLKYAQQVQQQLNLPWMSMLTALEEVKKSNPNIHLLGIGPIKDRAEIKLNGEAMKFTDITHFLDELRANKVFSDAALVSQHLEQDDSIKSQDKLIYVFEIKLDWRL